MGLFDEYGIDPDEVPDGPSYDVPDGVYVFEIGRTFEWEDDDDDNPRRAFVIEYLLDDEEGTTGTKSEWFGRPIDPDNLTDRDMQNASFLKTRLLSLGVAREALGTFEGEQLEGLTGTLQLVSTAGKGKNKGKTFQNIRNVRVAEEEEAPAAPAKKAPAARAGKAATVKTNPFANRK